MAVRCLRKTQTFHVQSLWPSQATYSVLSPLSSPLSVLNPSATCRMLHSLDRIGTRILPVCAFVTPSAPLLKTLTFSICKTMK